MAALMDGTALTADLDIPSADGWVEVVTAKNVVAQVKSNGRVNAWLVGDGGDPPDTANVGITLARGITGVESSFGAGNMPDGATLWLKALAPQFPPDQTVVEQVTVIAY